MSQRNLSRLGYVKYNKQDLFNSINAIEIFKQGNQVVTKYFNRVVNTSTVSDRYEIFDIRTFLMSKIDQIEANFKISYSKFRMKGGIQELVLLSDEVDINGTSYYKSFFILNSSDKSRRLNLNMGLFRSDNGTYMINSITNLSLCKKHLKGVTQSAEDTSSDINGETFNEQIESLKSLIGERVMLSQVRNTVIDKDIDINHKRFDAFKNSLRWSMTDKVSLTEAQIKTISTPSKELKLDYTNDFSIDAYKIFNCYLKAFCNQDSYIVKRETERILKITQCFIREEKISQLLDLV